MTQSSMNKYIIFIAMIFVYLISMTFYYFHTKEQLIDKVETKIEDVLLTHSALKVYIDHKQKPEINRLKDENLLFKGYFSKVLLSSTHVSSTLNKITNEKRISRGKMPLYLKYSSDNPLNQKNLSTDYERHVLNQFRLNKSQQYRQIRHKKNGRFLFYALPGAKIKPSCLECHGQPTNAPLSIQQHYGLTSGYHMKVGDLSSILSIEIPLEELYKENIVDFIYQALFVLILFILFFFLALFVINITTHRKHLHQNTIKMQASLTHYSKHIIRTRTDSSGIFIEASYAFYELTGYTSKELLGQKHHILQVDSTDNSQYAQMQIILLQGHQYHGEMQLKAKNGSYFWVSLAVSPIKDINGHITEFETVYTNISKQKSLEEDANTDAMTLLLNRRTFDTHFKHEYTQAEKNNQKFAFLMIDIDYFKLYNDNYGHSEGDIVLKSVADALKTVCKDSTSYVFRLGGEEFGIILSHKDQNFLVETANNCCMAVEKLNITHQYSLASDVITISIGILITNFNVGIDFDEYYQKSDLLLYQAKQSGRNCVKADII